MKNKINPRQIFFFELPQPQKICYRIVAPLQKTNNVKLTQLKFFFFSVQITVIYKSLVNKKKLGEISTNFIRLYILRFFLLYFFVLLYFFFTVYN